MNSFLKKTFCFLLVSCLCVFVFGFFAKVTAAEEIYKTALFGSSYNSNSVNDYISTWSSTNEGFTVNLENFNNNNNGWNYVKCGRKNNASVGTITTNAAIDKAVTKVVVTIDAVTASKVNSIQLKIDSANTFNSEGVVILDPDGDIKAGSLTFTIATPTTNKYYKLVFDCASNSSNGVVTISKVDYYVTAADVPVSSVSLNKNSTSIALGNTEQLTATVLPDNATNKNVTWSSSDNAVATVSETGLVTAVDSGSATITATSQADGTKSASCAVTVTAAVSVTGVELTASEFAYVGGTEQLVANVLPANAFNKTVFWDSSDINIATISDDGLVTAVAPGNVSITVLTDDGDFEAICSFEVRALPASGEVSVLEALKIANASGDADSTNSYVTIGRVKTKVANNEFVLTDELNDITVYKSSHGCNVDDRVKVTGKLRNYGLTKPEYTSTPTIKKLYNVTFESNGGSAVAGLVDVEAGSKINAPANPTKAGQTFMGWYKDELLTDDWDFNSDTVTSSITLYAFYLDSLIGEIQNRLNAVNSYMSLAYSYSGSYYGFGLTRADMTFAGSSYSNFTSTYYSGNAYKTDGKIQLRSDQETSGIILVNNDKGNIKRVIVEWNASTVSGRTLNVYGSNSAYSSAADLYDENKYGELLGTIVYGTSTSLDITGDYTYIGLRSNSGALYLNYVIADNNETTSVDFRFKCAVDANVSGVLDGASGTYGIEVSDGTTTRKYQSDNALVYTQGGKTYVVIKLGDVFTDLSRLTDEFTVRAYAYYDGNYYYSSQTVTYSFVSLLQTYINNPAYTAQLNGLRQSLIGLGLVE